MLDHNFTKEDQQHIYSPATQWGCQQRAFSNLENLLYFDLGASNLWDIWKFYILYIHILESYIFTPMCYQVRSCWDSKSPPWCYLIPVHPATAVSLLFVSPFLLLNQLTVPNLLPLLHQMKLFRPAGSQPSADWISLLVSQPHAKEKVSYRAKMQFEWLTWGLKCIRLFFFLRSHYALQGFHPSARSCTAPQPPVVCSIRWYDPMNVQWSPMRPFNTDCIIMTSVMMVILWTETDGHMWKMCTFICCFFFSFLFSSEQFSSVLHYS